MNNITIDDFLKLSNLNIIDIRNEQSYNNNHIPGSINVPYNKIITNSNLYLKKGTRYYIYCQRGITSSKLCSYLLTLGFNVVNILGGYEEWIMKK